MDARHLSAEELAAGIDEVRGSPAGEGTVELIVRRPQHGEREVLAEGVLDPVEGLVGDTWRARGSRSTPDGSADREVQVTLMNARAAALVAQERERWALAGDQLYVDLDLSAGNVPPGTRLGVGSAVVEATAEPHTGCGKFRERFGLEAIRLLNSPAGQELRLRGINTKVVEGGTVRQGDTIRKL